MYSTGLNSEFIFSDCAQDKELTLPKYLLVAVELTENDVLLTDTRR